MSKRAARDEAQRRRALDAVTSVVEAGSLDMRSVAAQANISVSTLYRHFGSKDGLHEESLCSQLEVWRNVVATHLRESSDQPADVVLTNFYLMIIRRKRQQSQTHLLIWAENSPAGRRYMDDIYAIHGEVVNNLLQRMGLRMSHSLAEVMLPGFAAMLARVTSTQALLRKASSDRLVARRLANSVVAATAAAIATRSPAHSAGSASIDLRGEQASAPSAQT